MGMLGWGLHHVIDGRVVKGVARYLIVLTSDISLCMACNGNGNLKRIERRFGRIITVRQRQGNVDIAAPG